MGILDPLFSLRQLALFSHAEASLGFRRLRREKKKARVGTRFPLSNVPRASTIIIFIIIVFFMESLREPLFRRKRERCLLFCFPLHLV